MRTSIRCLKSMTPSKHTLSLVSSSSIIPFQPTQLPSPFQPWASGRVPSLSHQSLQNSGNSLTLHLPFTLSAPFSAHLCLSFYGEDYRQHPSNVPPNPLPQEHPARKMTFPFSLYSMAELLSLEPQSCCGATLGCTWRLPWEVFQRSGDAKSQT